MSQPIGCLNQKLRLSAWPTLNQILNKRNNFSDKIKLNENYSNYYAPNKYESDYTKNKNKYNISDAMNILLDKDNKY